MEAPNIDTIFQYKGFWDCISCCHLRIWRRGENAIIAVPHFAVGTSFIDKSHSSY